MIEGFFFSLDNGQRHLFAYLLLALLVVVLLGINWAAKRNRRRARVYNRGYGRGFRRLNRFEKLLSHMRII